MKKRPDLGISEAFLSRDRRERILNPFGDTDNDGVLNLRDCKPFDPDKHKLTRGRSFAGGSRGGTGGRAGYTPSPRGGFRYTPGKGVITRGAIISGATMRTRAGYPTVYATLVGTPMGEAAYWATRGMSRSMRGATIGAIEKSYRAPETLTSREREILRPHLSRFPGEFQRKFYQAEMKVKLREEKEKIRPEDVSMARQREIYEKEDIKPKGIFKQQYLREKAIKLDMPPKIDVPLIVTTKPYDTRVDLAPTITKDTLISRAITPSFPGVTTGLLYGVTPETRELARRVVPGIVPTAVSLAKTAIGWAPAAVILKKYEKFIAPAVGAVKHKMDIVRAYSEATTPEGLITAFEKTEGRKLTKSEREKVTRAFEKGEEVTGEYRRRFGLPAEEMEWEREGAKFQAKVLAGQFRSAEEQFAKQIIEPISVKVAGERARAIQKQEREVQTNIKDLERISIRHPEWRKPSGEIILPTKLKPGVEKAAEKNPEKYLTPEGYYKDRYIEYTPEAKQYMDVYIRYDMSQAKLESLPKPTPERQIARGVAEAFVSLPIMPISMLRVAAETVVAPTKAPIKGKKFVEEYAEFAKREPFRVAGQIAGAAILGTRGKVVEYPGLRVGEVTGLVRKRVHIVEKGETVPYMSRAEQVQTILEQKNITGTRTVTQPVGKYIRIRDPGEVGDIPAFGVKGGFMTIGRKTMYEAGKYFITKEKPSLKGKILGSRIYELKVRTVDLPQSLKNKVYDSIRTKGTFEDLYPEILKIAKEQSRKTGEPIAVPSPKRAWGYPERDPTVGVGMAVVPENEAFMVFATDAARKVTSKRTVGFARDGTPIQQLRYGNQPKIVGKGIPVLENIMYNIRAKENYLKAATEQMQRKVGELYEGKLSYAVEYEIPWKHGRVHAEAVEANMRHLRDLYPSLKKLSDKEIHLIAKYHDIAKTTWYETEPLKHAKAAAQAIRKGRLKDPLLEGLSRIEREKIARAIELHERIKPNFLHEIIYGPTPAAKALATADRMDLVRLGKIVDTTKLFKFKTPRARGELSNFYNSWTKRLQEFAVDDYGKMVMRFMKDEDKIISRMVKRGDITGYKGKMFSYKYPRISKKPVIGVPYGMVPKKYPVVSKVEGYLPVTVEYTLAPTKPYYPSRKPYEKPGKPYKPPVKGYEPIGKGYLERIGYKPVGDGYVPPVSGYEPPAIVYEPPGVKYEPPAITEVPGIGYEPPPKKGVKIPVVPRVKPEVEERKKIERRRRRKEEYFKFGEVTGVLLPEEIIKRTPKKRAKRRSARPRKRRSVVESYMLPM